mgnify:CR=1 FL=1
MSHSETQEQPTLFGELPIAHIRIDVPVLDGEAIVGFSLVSVDLEGRMIASTSWSAGAFTSDTHMAMTLASELVDLLKRASPTLE